MGRSPRGSRHCSVAATVERNVDDSDDVDDGDVQVTRERSWAERDAELRARAIILE